MRVPARRDGVVFVQRDQVPSRVLDRLAASCEHVDSSYRAGRAHSPIVRTLLDRGSEIGVPPGALERLQSYLAEEGRSLVVAGHTGQAVEMSVPADFKPRAVQQAISDLVEQHECGVFRVATGAGKTEGALLAMARRQRSCLIVVPDVALLDQWVVRAESFLGTEVGVVGGGQKRVRDVTVMVPDSLLRDASLSRQVAACDWDSAWVDECQQAGTSKVLRALETACPSRAYGLSADERRADGLDRVAADWVGPVRYEVTREQAVEAGWILPVTVLLVPTSHGRRLSGSPPSSGRAYDQMLLAMAGDEEREALLDRVIARQLRTDRGPVVALCHRVAHAEDVSARWRAGRLLGGQTHRREFQAVLGALRAGQTSFAAGTLQSMGVGKDVRGLRTVVVVTPFGRDWARGFGQVMGRACRVDADDPSKSEGYVVVLEDRRLYGDRVADQVLAWTSTSTEVRRWVGRGWEVLRRR